MKKPTKPPVAKGGQPLPPGARSVPGSESYRKMQGAPHPGEIFVGKSFLADSRGGPPLVLGRKVFRVEGDKPREKR